MRSKIAKNEAGKRRPSFNPKSILAKVGEGRSIGRYSKDQIDFSQGDPAEAVWRAAKYLSVGQLYLYDNSLLKKPLTFAHIKPRLLGHWGTTPRPNFIHVHLSRLIKKCDLGIFTFPDTAVARCGEIVVALRSSNEKSDCFRPGRYNC